MSYKYCQKCGSANDSGNKFCEACGANFEEQERAAEEARAREEKRAAEEARAREEQRAREERAQQQRAAQQTWAAQNQYADQYGNEYGQRPATAPKKSGGKAKIIVPIILILLLAGGGVFAYFHFFAKTEVDLVGGFDDKVLNMTGKSGEIMIIDLDEKKIKELQHYNDADPKVQKFLDSVEYEYDREGEDDLANGDKVVITATFSEKEAEECGVRVVNAKNGEVDTTVKIVGRDEKKEDAYQSDNSSDSYNDNSSNSGTNNQNNGRDYSMDRDDTYYDVSETELEYSDVKNWDKGEIQNWINYICAKNGYEFHESGKVKDKFESMEWYNDITGKTRSNEVVEKRLAGIEKENYKVLVKARKNKN
jgi:uncharacterized Zn finger protein (UPF0148 family)